MDESGVDLAEFCFYDSTAPTGCYRLWSYQWPMYKCPDPLQVDQGARATGKLLKLETPVATPSGWTTMGELQDGDELFDDQGRVCRVTQAHPIQLSPESYDVVFSDEATITACADHLWVTRDKAARRADGRGTSARSAKVERRRARAVELRAQGWTLQRIADELGYADKTGAAYAIQDAEKPTVGAKPEVRTTREILQTLRCGSDANHSVDVPGPLQLPDADLPIDPYLLGVWLGDGDSSGGVLTMEREDKIPILNELQDRGFVLTPLETAEDATSRWKVEGLTPALRAIGVLHHKHIPMLYQRSSEMQRKQLLNGLFDTDGYLDSRSTAEWKFMNDPLAQSALDLLYGLGQKPGLVRGRATIYGVDKGEFQRITWKPTFDPSLRRSKHPFRLLAKRSLSFVKQRRIVDVRSVPNVLMRCITVDSPSNQYLVGREMIPTHNTAGVVMRTAAFPFCFSGQDMLLAAPQKVHLDPLTGGIESRFRETRLLTEMMPKTQAKGIKNQPAWQMTLRNGTVIYSRIPGDDGLGFKGMHVIRIELDESQDLHLKGWTELSPTLNRWEVGFSWRCHGVPRGGRDRFYDITEGAQVTGDTTWTRHRPMAFMRPNWGAAERQEAIVNNGGSRQHVDYKRNIYGLHGDASNPVFVVAKLMACVDNDEGSAYNSTVYHRIQILGEQLPKEEAELALTFDYLVLPPQTHLKGWSQKRAGTEVGSPRGYDSYWGGMDVGATRDPSEILICGQRAGSDYLDLLLRINMQRVPIPDQAYVVDRVFEFYGDKLKSFGLDATALGMPLAQLLVRRSYGSRVHGYNFSSNVLVGFSEDPTGSLKLKDLAEMRNFIEASTDWLRNEYIHAGSMRLPYDREVLLEFQGQSYTTGPKTSANPYGTRRFTGASYHTLDAMKTLMAGKFIPPLEAMLEEPETLHDVILPIFL